MAEDEPADRADLLPAFLLQEEYVVKILPVRFNIIKRRDHDDIFLFKNQATHTRFILSKTMVLLYPPSWKASIIAKPLNYSYKFFPDIPLLHILCYYHPMDRFCRMADMVLVVLMKEDIEMTIACPNCKELIDDHAGPCPMCKHMITAEYILRCEQERKIKDDEHTREMMEIYSKRRRIANWGIAIYLVAIFVTLIALYKINLPMAIILVFAEMVISIIIDYNTKCNDCPYCDKRLYVQKNHCPHCGGRLR